MRIADFIDRKSALWIKYNSALSECQNAYPQFEVDAPLHQMFAVCVMVIREMERKENERVNEE